MIVSGFRAALDLGTYPLSNFIRLRFAEPAKRGKLLYYFSFNHNVWTITGTCVTQTTIIYTLSCYSEIEINLFAHWVMVKIYIYISLGIQMYIIICKSVINL